MYKHILTKTTLAVSMLVFLFSNSFAAKKAVDSRRIQLAGLIVDAQSLAPIADAKIYDAQNNLLGGTGKNGYYHISIDDSKSGDIYFGIKIVKQGYQNFVQNEHWGNLDNPQNIMYFGLKPTHSASKPFASFASSRSINNNLSYNNVLSNFEKVKKEKDFNDKLDKAKAGNDNVLISIDDQLYIVDNTGWIRINSAKDFISINNAQVLTADQLNSSIRRKDIKGMTPVDFKEAKFAIYTKNIRKDGK